MTSLQTVLPGPTRISRFLTALFTTWLQLHLNFAVYDAKVDFAGNPPGSVAHCESQVFNFPGEDEPLFTDVL